MGSFKGLQIRQLNDLDARSTSMRSFCANDVVVCQRSSMVNIHLKDLPKFATVILDCRYAKQSNQLRLNRVRTEQSICVPNDLSSQAWWKNIIELVSTVDVDRRLLVDSFDRDSKLSYLHGLTSKEYLTITALRTAFLIGPKWFATPIYPIEKAILAWARQTTKRQATVGSKFTQVRSLLSKICAKSYFSTDADIDNFDWLEKYISCDILYCTMSQVQRFAYNRACQQSHLVLSMNHDNQNEKALDDVAACLLLLRRCCFHSDIDSILRHTTASSAVDHESETVCNLPRNFKIPQHRGHNAAQPDIDLCRRILTGSSKLRQLVSILHRNEEFKLFGSSDYKEYGFSKSIDTRVSNLVDHKTKIAIVAALPEIQLLVSCLLHSLGIHHEVLMTHSSARLSLNLGDNKDSLSWPKVQTLLSKFNDRTDSNLHIVIASLVTIEGDHVGLGIESADIIILLDENWSGQDERLLHSVISRCSLKRKFAGRSSVKLIRLVTECTCEETFLRNNSGVQYRADNLTSWYKRHHTVDSVKSTEVKSRNETPAKIFNGQQDSSFFMFCFPGQNIFRHRNKALDDILRPTRSLSRLNPISIHRLFLPGLSDDESTNIEAKITSYIIHLEDLRRGSSDQREVIPPTVLDEIHPWQSARNCLPPAPLRNFIRQQFEAMVLEENESILSLSNVTLALKVGTRSMKVSDHIESEAKSILSREPSEVALSMLLYTHDVSCVNGDVTTDNTKSHRGNRYAASFSTLSAGALRHDGNQGVEALVYFPPVFPKLREFVDTSIDYISLKRQHWTTHDKIATDGSNHYLSSQKEGNHFTAESIDFDTDFGLAGVGLFPSLEDSVSAAAGILSQTETPFVESIDSLDVWRSHINVEEYQTKLQHRSANKSTKSVILMVSRKRPRGQSNISYQARHGTFLWNEISSPISEILPSVDVNGVHKKGRKAVSAFNRLPLADTAQHARPTLFPFQRKDDYRHRLLSTLRQSSTNSGSTIFEAPIFRVAAVRIRDKISDRLQEQAWTTLSNRIHDKSRSGLPITSYEGDSKKSWTSIVSHSHKPATISDEHINEIARQKTIVFQKSYVEPRRVDFGPFQLGFVTSTSGMASITYPRARIGVALPMGVKISILSKEQTAAQWSKDMDRILASSINRFGSNWILASRLLNSYFGTLVLHKESNFYRIQCAPRHCRDRWRLLTKEGTAKSQYDSKSNTQVTQNVGDAGSRKVVSNQSKRGIIKMELLIPTSIDNVVPAKVVNDTLLHSKSSPTKRESSRRKFTAFQLGSAKQQNMPVPKITGVASVASPCHPSHELTVQMSTMAVNGRTDMWPLQILDGAERLRTAAAVGVESNGQSATSRRPVIMSSRPHNNSRSAGPSNPNSQSTNASQVPVQRATSSSGTSSSHPQYSSDQVTASKERFVPPMQAAKAISTPKVLPPTSNTIQQPQNSASQPSKSINTSNNSIEQPSAVPTKTAVPVASLLGGAIVPPTACNGTTSTVKTEPFETISVAQLSQELVTKNTTATSKSVEQAQPSNRAESTITTSDLRRTDSKVPAKVANDVAETIQTIVPSTNTNLVAVSTTEVSKPVERSTEAVPNTMLPTPTVPNESTPITE